MTQTLQDDARPAIAPAPVALDHVVIGADSLEQGVRWCEGVLGVTPGPGGKHALMGTHNRLLRLAGAADLPGSTAAGAYLEIIAIDPHAPSPGRPRWFGLDRRMPGAPPQLVQWVLRVPALAPLAAAMRAAGDEPGPALALTRQRPTDELRWLITVTEDGAPAARGAAPALIEWSSEHPALAMPPSGVALAALTVRGLAPALQPLLAAPGVVFDGADGAGSRPVLSLDLLCPRGRIRLESCS